MEGTYTQGTHTQGNRCIFNKSILSVTSIRSDLQKCSLDQAHERRICNVHCKVSHVFIMPSLLCVKDGAVNMPPSTCPLHCNEASRSSSATFLGEPYKVLPILRPTSVLSETVVYEAFLANKAFVTNLAHQWRMRYCCSSATGWQCNVSRLYAINTTTTYVFSLPML